MQSHFKLATTPAVLLDLLRVKFWSQKEKKQWFTQVTLILKRENATISYCHKHHSQGLTGSRERNVNIWWNRLSRRNPRSVNGRDSSSLFQSRGWWSRCLQGVKAESRQMSQGRTVVCAGTGTDMVPARHGWGKSAERRLRSKPRPQSSSWQQISAEHF